MFFGDFGVLCGVSHKFLLLLAQCSSVVSVLLGGYCKSQREANSSRTYFSVNSFSLISGIVSLYVFSEV